MHKLCCVLNAVGQCAECSQPVCAAHGGIYNENSFGYFVKCDSCATARDLLSSFEKPSDVSDPEAF